MAGRVTGCQQGHDHPSAIAARYCNKRWNAKRDHNWGRTPNGVRCSRCGQPKQAGAPPCFPDKKAEALVDRLVEEEGATEFVAPGEGSTLEELLNRISQYLEAPRRYTARERNLYGFKNEPLDDDYKAARMRARGAARNLKALPAGVKTNLLLTSMPVVDADFERMKQAQ